MEMKSIRIKKPGVTQEGNDVPVGTVITVPARSAFSLVDDELADFVAQQPKAPEIDKEAEGRAAAEKAKAKAAAEAEAAAKAAAEAEAKEAAEKAAKEAAEKAANQNEALAKALDDKYNKEPLADVAKAAGVEFSYDAKKADIIAAVIAAGKAEALLKA